jgi:geranylgeranyl diphosphate synthase, type I
MFLETKNKIDGKLKGFIVQLDAQYSLKTLSPLLYSSIKDFVLRDGKRVRPVLFVMGYLGFCKRKAEGLYESAVAIELLHDFLLVHDDIVDKSPTRRGKPSMHMIFQSKLSKYDNLKFNGQDLAIIAGDVMYAMAMNSFLSIKEDPVRKEKALRHFLQAAVYTGAGEFIELLSGAKEIDKTAKDDIYKIYDFKTAHYTFSVPLSTGAILGGAGSEEIKLITEYGIALGRAFQINDDLIGLFGNEQKIGKSTLSDLQEAKKTLPLWYAFRLSSKEDKKTIKKIMAKKRVNRSDLALIKTIVIETGARAKAEAEIASLIENSQTLLSSLRIKQQFKIELKKYSQKILSQ